MQIVLDAHIPFASDIFSKMGEVHAVAGHDIGPETVKNADMLVVRSITRVDKELLNGSRIRFVGSATAGTDHIDTEYLSGSGVQFANAPGANADSVVEYVLASLALLSSKSGEHLLEKSIGIVGCGNVGGRLADLCTALGMAVFLNDPPREEEEGSALFTPLPELLERCDILSIHTPLINIGRHSTLDLISHEQIGLLREGTWLVHTARGGVCNEGSLLRARREGRLSGLVIDVWENEPFPNSQLMEAADVATGHIAGYSIDAKRRGVMMIREAASRFFESSGTSAESAGDPIERTITESGRATSETGHLDSVIRQMVAIRGDDQRFRAAMARTEDRALAFHTYRADYPERYSFSAYRAPATSTDARISSGAQILIALGLQSPG